MARVGKFRREGIWRHVGIVQCAMFRDSSREYQLFFDPTMYRAKALACEQQARLALDPAAKRDWEELAIEWHTIAHFATRRIGETPQIEE
jgi:hypothetical protein